MSLANKVALITGASSGIGASTAILFAKEGANFAMVGRNQKKLDAVSAKVATVGKKPLVINADISKDEDIKRIIKDTIAKFGRLDVLVNNAGFVNNGSILEGRILEAYDAVMSVNVRGVVHLTTLAAPHLIATKGNIVNISSVGALTTPVSPEYLAYSVSKAALDQFTRGAAKELANAGVRVNSVNPGPVATDFIENAGLEVKWESFSEMTALNRTAKPEEIAEMILYVASEKAKGVTGSILLNDCGFSLKN